MVVPDQFSDFRALPRIGVGAVALILSVGVCLFATWAVWSVYESECARETAALESILDEAVHELTYWAADQTRRATDIAVSAEGSRLATTLIRMPQDSREADELRAQYELWVSPLYQGNGFTGYVLATRRGNVIASSWLAETGESMPSGYRDTLQRAWNTGAAISAPQHALEEIADGLERSDTTYQLVCARIRSGQASPGVLCLRFETGAVLMPMIRAGRFGKTGELYAVGIDGHPVTPTPLEQDGAISKYPTLDTWSMPAFWTWSIRPASPLGHGHGKRMVGLAKWLPEMSLGVVVKQSLSEVLASYRFSRDIIVVFAGTTIGLIVILGTALYRAARRLAQSHERLRGVFAHSPAVIHLKDRRHAMVLANPALCALVGRNAADMIGKTDFEFDIVPDGAQLRWDVEEQVMVTGVAQRHVYHMDTEDGRRHIQVVRFPVCDPEDGWVIGVGAVGLDVTEQVEVTRRLEELSLALDHKVAERTMELTEANSALEVAMRAAEAEAQEKASFLANMSHEVRTPLNAVIGMAHLTLKTRLDVRQRGYLEMIQNSGQHLLEIVDEILDLSRIEAGKLEIDRTAFSLETLVHAVSDLVAEAAASKGLELIVDIAPGLPDVLMGDPLRIRQVLANLASNAVKFTEHGEVAIRVDCGPRPVASPNRAVRFEVRDSGAGIRWEDRARLFESFEQGDITTARRYGGSGLGLAVCRHLVGLMGGNIMLTSEVGEGSAFFVDLELDTPVEADARIDALVGPEEGGSRSSVVLSEPVRMLVVDDHPYARRLTANAYREMGFEVDETGSGEAALRSVRAADDEGSPYRIMLVDTLMPGMDGIETARRVHSMILRNARPRCVLMALLGKEPSLDAAEDDVIDAMVYKPVSRTTLIEAALLALRGELKVDVPRASSHERVQDSAIDPAASVLVVDDNEISRDLAVQLLLDAGVSVDSAGTGTRALELIRTKPYDLILMDIRMPLMDGIETMRRIRSEGRFRNQRIVAMTANALHDDVEHYLAKGMDDCIVKPIVPEAFYAALRRWLPAGEPSLQAGASDSTEATDEIDGIDGIGMLAQCAQLDLRAGMTHVAGKPHVYRGLIERFVREYANAVERIESDLISNRDAVALLAHSLKGVAGIIGATRLSSAAGALERLLITGIESHADPLVGHVALIKAEITPLLAALRACLKIDPTNSGKGASAHGMCLT